MALRDALNFYRSVSIEISPEVGGTTYWVRLPADFSVEYLASEAERRGILIGPVAHYYARDEDAENCFRMGVTSLPEVDTTRSAGAGRVAAGSRIARWPRAG